MSQSSPFIKPPERENRRKRKDIFTKCVQWFAAVSWIIAVAIVLIFAFAQPPRENIYTHLLNFIASKAWNMKYIYFAVWMLIANIAVCLFGLIFNAMRHKRKTDRFNKSILILGTLSVISLIAISVRFF